MKLIIALLLGYCIFFSQENVIVYTTEGDTTQFHKFEITFIQDIINLYNLNSTSKINYTIHEISFKDILEKMKVPSNNTLGIGTITRTKHREQIYDFSVNYYPIQSVIFSLPKNKKKSFKNSSFGLTTGSLEEELVVEYIKEHNVTPYFYSNFNDKLSAIMQGDILFSFTDNIQVLTNPNIIEILTIEQNEQMGLSVIYPKNSEMKKLNKYIDYYTHSNAYYHLLRDIFGENASKYFKQNLK